MVLKRTINKISKLGVQSTVLWTGNGYHVYLPLEAMVLDREEVFSKEMFSSLSQSSFSKYYGYSGSELLLKFAKEYLTNDKTDPQHHPKYKNSLVRILGTYDSKCLDRGLSREEFKVKIIQKWDGKRLPIQLLLKGFRIWIVQEEIDLRRKIEKLKSKEKPTSTNDTDSISWIERLLQTPIEDERKYYLWRIISPYLLNGKNL